VFAVDKLNEDLGYYSTFDIVHVYMILDDAKGGAPGKTTVQTQLMGRAQLFYIRCDDKI
jgi:hypothetical protein